ncbi:hypothetical protein IMCC26207_10571 [Actinobacteria bacterium IMCC26207]|nr:hypothetical protein IMCC26207_10571 [Actinobacteria bacterium IMCC26207]
MVIEPTRTQPTPARRGFIPRTVVLRAVVLRAVVVATAVLCVIGVSGCSVFRPSNDSLAELAGPDGNNNGIRDDVETRIRELTSDPLMIEYLESSARYMQKIVLFDDKAPNAKETAFELATESDILISCAPESLDEETASDYFFEVEDKIRNTRGRKAKFDRVGELIDGRAFPAPDCETARLSTSPITPTK